MDAAMLLVKVWFFFSSASGVFLLPYLNLYLLLICKYSGAQIGVLSVLRPWISSLASAAGPAVADRYKVHRSMLFLSMGLSVGLRAVLPTLPSSVFLVGAVILVADVLGAPSGVIIDSHAASSAVAGEDYGKQRLWSSIGWGSLAFAAGKVIDTKGFTPAFIIHVAFAIPCLVSGLLMWKHSAKGSGPALMHASPPQTPGDNTRADSNMACNRSSSSSSSSVWHHISPSTTVHGTCYLRDSVSPATESVSLVDSTKSLPTAEAANASTSSGHASVDGHTPPNHRHSTRSHSSASSHSHSAALLAMEEGVGIAGRLASVHGIEDLPVRKLDLGAGACDPDEVQVAEPASDGAPVQQYMQMMDAERMHTLALSEHGSANGMRPGSAAPILPYGTLVAERLEAQAIYNKLGYMRVGSSFTASEASLRKRGTGSPASLTGDPNRLSPVGSKTGHSRRFTAAGSQTGSEAGKALGGGDGEPPVPFRAAVCQLLASSAVWMFLARCCLLGFGTGAIGTCLFLFVDGLGSSHGLEGLMLMFNCVAEVPMFACAQALQARTSLNTLFHVATGVLAGRLLLYTLLPALGQSLLWMVLGIELLQGITFALAWNTACVYSAQLAPERLRATMQGLTQTAYWGIGNGVGGLVSACLYDGIGGQRMFALMALMATAGWGITMVVQLMLARRSVHSTRCVIKDGSMSPHSILAHAAGENADAAKLPKAVVPFSSAMVGAIIVSKANQCQSAGLGLPGSDYHITLYAPGCEEPSCCPTEPLLAGVRSSTVDKE